MTKHIIDMRAFEAGKEAYRLGDVLDDCPCTDQLGEFSWDEGWWAARRADEASRWHEGVWTPPEEAA